MTAVALLRGPGDEADGETVSELHEFVSRLRMLIVDGHVPRTVASVHPPKSSMRWFTGSSAVVKPWLADGSAPEVANGVQVT
jgi:hypothetical protein